MLAGAAVGALIGGRLADLFGRRRLLIATAIIFALGAILCAMATSPMMLAVGRIIVGFGIGLSSSGVPVYISEVAPADARGWQVSLFQLAITVGILLAYLVDYAFAGIQGWRWMFGLAVIPAAIFGTGMLFLPESPRWLLRRGQGETARAMLARIRGTADIEAEIPGNRAVRDQSAGERPLFRSLYARDPARARCRNRVGDLPANHRNQYRHLLRAAHDSERGNFVRFRRDSCNRGHRRGERAYDDFFHVADRPERTPTLAADGDCRDGGHSGLAGVCVSRVAPIDRNGLAGGDQHDGLCRFVCYQSGPDFLAVDI